MDKRAGKTKAKFQQEAHQEKIQRVQKSDQ